MRPETLSGLAVFRVVAAERSFTRAATRLGVTQSALSQTVKRLEADLGIRLLDRTTRSVSPNAAGERLLATLEPALVGVEAELAALVNLRDRAAGTIRVTAGRHAADTVLAPAIARLLTAPTFKSRPASMTAMSTSSPSGLTPESASASGCRAT